ncbi:MAG: hypothetical protein AB8B55_12945 [Mariniblastus sp.]
MSDEIHKAIWTPGWYELDQTLSIGERQKFWFFQTPPDECVAADSEVDLVFYNQLDSSKNCAVRYARIVEMYHPQLGSLLRVDTDGLDYIFFPVDGEEIVVNAEEDPGTTCDGGVMVEDWTVFVTLSEVSEPVVDVA